MDSKKQRSGSEQNPAKPQIESYDPMEEKLRFEPRSDSFKDALERISAADDDI